MHITLGPPLSTPSDSDPDAYRAAPRPRGARAAKRAARTTRRPPQGPTGNRVLSMISVSKGIRVVSVPQGYDPRDCALVAVGGNGPVHAGR